MGISHYETAMKEKQDFFRRGQADLQQRRKMSAEAAGEMIPENKKIIYKRGELYEF